MPLPKRWLTSCMFRYNGSSLLIDAGEGTQIAMRELGWSPKPIDTILLTHFHADHIAGLPGLLLLMGNADRTEPLTIIGPKGTGRMLSAVRTIAPELPFETRAVEIEGNDLRSLHFACSTASSATRIRSRSGGEENSTWSARRRPVSR